MRAIKSILPVSIATALLLYVLKDISLLSIVQTLQQANQGWILLAISLVSSTYLLRGKRWQQALAALGYQSTTFRATVAMQSGTIPSMIIPGSGELTRCATIQRTDGVPFSHSVGSVVAERVLDLLMLVVLLIVTFVVELRRMQEYLAALSFVKTGVFWGSLLLGGILAGFILYRIWLLPFVQGHPFTARVKGFTRGLGEGFLAIRRLPSPALFIGLTVSVQVLGLVSTYFMFLSLGITELLPFTAALTVMAVASIGGLAVPTQGGIGTYHFFVSRALTLYGLSDQDAVVAATFMHAVGFAINLLLSSISFLIIPFLVTTKEPKQTKTIADTLPQNAASETD